MSFVTEALGTESDFILPCVILTDRQTAADPVADQTRCVSETSEGPKLIFIRHDMLKPHLPCHAVDPGMERLPMG